MKRTRIKVNPVLKYSASSAWTDVTGLTYGEML